MEIPNKPLKLMIEFVILHNCDLFQEIEHQEHQLHENITTCDWVQSSISLHNIDNCDNLTCYATLHRGVWS